MDKVVTIGREVCESEFSHRRSTSPPGSPLFAAALSLTNDVHIRFRNKESKKIKRIKQVHQKRSENRNIQPVCPRSIFIV